MQQVDAVDLTEALAESFDDVRESQHVRGQVQIVHAQPVVDAALAASRLPESPFLLVNILVADVVPEGRLLGNPVARQEPGAVRKVVVRAGIFLKRASRPMCQ